MNQIKTAAEKVFGEELEIIADGIIKEFVIYCYSSLAPDYFWTVPASTSGKYHPDLSRGPGGLVRHVRYAVWWGLELMACCPDTGMVTIDELVAALLLHDILKNGDKLDSRGRPTLRDSTSVHGPYLGKKINELLNEDRIESAVFADDKRIKRIIEAVESHMGRWTLPMELKPQYRTDADSKILCDLVHLADYCASRKADSEMEWIDKTTEVLEIRYAIGDEDGECGVGFWHGPNPKLGNMLKEFGRSEKSIIVELNPINGDKPIYRWNTDDDYWKPIDDKVDQN
jgi:hypothetical protein